MIQSLQFKFIIFTYYIKYIALLKELILRTLIILIVDKHKDFVEVLADVFELKVHYAELAITGDV